MQLTGRPVLGSNSLSGARPGGAARLPEAGGDLKDQAAQVLDGALGDAKMVLQPERSFYIPDTLSSPSIAQTALEQMDTTLRRLSNAATASGGNGVIEITTNNMQATQFIEGRMRALAITGYVRVG